MFVDILNLCGKYMWHGIFHGGRDVDNGFVVLFWLPDVQYGIAYIYGIVYFGAWETFRAVFKREVAVGLIGQFL